MFLFDFSISRVLILCLLLIGGAVKADTMTLAQDGRAAVSIVHAQDATPAELQAVQELATYLHRITGAAFNVVTEDQHQAASGIYVGQTRHAASAGIDFARLGKEEWVIRSDSVSLILAGGRPRGTLYAVYRFLEDDLGVRWWNPYEEFVPSRPSLLMKAQSRTGQPRFSYREIHYSFGGHPYDRWEGQFSARSRINAAGNDSIALKYGGAVRYGPPDRAHTFHMYLGNLDEAFAAHPEWFALHQGRRVKHSQLCLTNPELRAHFVERLRRYIEEGRAHAAKNNVAEPTFYAIQPVDGRQPWCECPRCRRILSAEGSYSALMIDFANAIGTKIADDYPDISLVTLAYLDTVEPPRSIKPRPNVLVQLADTASNMIAPITDATNQKFRDQLERWSRIADASNLLIWDYAVNFNDFPSTIVPIGMCSFGFPFPSYTTYQPDYQYMRDHSVRGLFIQHEYPIVSDMRDMKIWLEARLMEDPDRDYKSLVDDFVSGFYGPASPMIREYLALIETSAFQSRSFLTWTANPGDFKYLTMDFFDKAHAIFDRALEAAKDQPEYQRRVRHVRLHSDIAMLIRYPQLVRELKRTPGRSEKDIDRQLIAQRINEAWQEQCQLRWAAQNVREQAQEFIDKAMTLQDYPLPERFRSIPENRIYDFPAQQMSNHPTSRPVMLISDPDASTGYAHKSDLSRLPEFPLAKKSWYMLPLKFGIHDPVRNVTQEHLTIRREDIPGRGYHWYRLGIFNVSATDAYAYFYGGWEVQIPIGGIPRDNQRYEVWVNIKFEGPSYYDSPAEPTDAVYIERMIFIQRPAR